LDVSRKVRAIHTTKIADNLWHKLATDVLKFTCPDLDEDD